MSGRHRRPPKRQRLEKAAAVASEGGGEDRISALPDDALHHILSFLPSDQAVKTCVVARRWRHLWRYTRSLRVTPRPRLLRVWNNPWTPSKLTSFVNHFLLLRGAAVPVDECDILCGELDGDSELDEEDFTPAYQRKLDDKLNRAVCLWIRHAVVNSQARVLRVCFQTKPRLCLDDVPFDSQLLTRVELTAAKFYASVDFSRCPALQDLTMSECKIYGGDGISSTSLAHLTIANCYFHGNERCRTRISTPRLVSLKLSVMNGRTPVLVDKMPLLVAANVMLGYFCEDTCEHIACRCRHTGLSFDHKSSDGDSTDNCYCINDHTYGGGVYLESLACDSCYGTDDGSSVILQGLSEATDLELISDPRAFIFKKDCKSLATFSKLKTLLLNEWCMAGDFSALIYFLQCSPVLEKLTLQLGHCETRYTVIKTQESYNLKEELLSMPKQLNTIVIKCSEENELVKKLLLLLMTNGVPREQIQIEQNCPPHNLYDELTESDCGEDW